MKLALSLSLSLSLPSLAQAQVGLSVAAPSGTSYPRYVDRVLLESPTWADAQAAVRAADAEIDVARVVPSARLSGGIASLDVSGHDAPNATQVVLSMPIDYASQVGHRVDERIVEHQATIALADATRRDLSRLAAERFVDAIEASLLHARAIESADADATLLHAIESRAGVGEATALHVGLARLAAASGIARRTEAEGAERRAQIALSTLLGSVDESLIAVGTLSIPPRAFDADALVEEALSHRPEVRAAQLAEGAAERHRDLASALRWPELDVQVGWIHSFASLLPSIFNQPEYDAILVGATVEIPLRLAWDGDLRAADAGIERASAGLRARELAVSIEVREALTAYETARDRLAAREAVLGQAAELRRAAAQAMSMGASTVVELLAAQSAARDAEVAYVSAAAEHARALAILLARVGREENVL